MSKEEQTEKLTEQEVVETLEALQKAFDVTEFAQGYKTGVYSPMIQNELMKNMNVSATTPDKSGIESSLSDPANHEEELVSFSQSYYFSSLMLSLIHI